MGTAALMWLMRTPAASVGGDDSRVVDRRFEKLGVSGMVSGLLLWTVPNATSACLPAWAAATMNLRFAASWVSCRSRASLISRASLASVDSKVLRDLRGGQ